MFIEVPTKPAVLRHLDQPDQPAPPAQSYTSRVGSQAEAVEPRIPHLRARCLRGVHARVFVLGCRSSQIVKYHLGGELGHL